jgi:putative ABC transport system substrate-binding protein
VAAQQPRAAATQGAENCLSHDGLASGSQYTKAFIRGLADLGRVEGHNIAIEWRWGRGSTEQFPRYAAEVAGLNVDVIVAGNSPAGLAAKNATKTIPIVIATMEDPVQQGFATSLAHPGGSITGLNLQTPACRAQACLSYQNCL